MRSQVPDSYPYSNYGGLLLVTPNFSPFLTLLSFLIIKYRVNLKFRSYTNFDWEDIFIRN